MKKNNVLVLIIVILAILLAICLVIIYQNNYLGTKNEVLSGEENITENESVKDNTTEFANVDEEDNIVEEITGEERQAIEEYIDKICNSIIYVRLPEFDNINNADKNWIYFHVETREDNYYVTEDQIKAELSELFGPNLIIDVQNDTSGADGYFIPKYNEQEGRYEFWPIGDLEVYNYVIDTIIKEENTYVVNVVEYIESRDLERNTDEYTAISSYKKDNELEKIFEKNQETKNELDNKVLSLKDKFQNYEIVLEEIDNEIYVKSVEKK